MNRAGRVLRGMPLPGRGGASSRERGGWSPSPSTKRMAIAALIIVLLFAFVSLTSAFWVQWWWFDSIGYRSALTTRYLSGAVAFLVAALLAGGFFAINWHYAVARAPHARRSARFLGSRFIDGLLWLVTAAIAVIAGVAAAQEWLVWRLALNGGSFGVTEPIFGRDAGFYVFQLPALTLIHQGAIAVAILSLAVAAVLYFAMRGLDRLDGLPAPPEARRHLLGLAALVLVLFAAGYLLTNFDLLYSHRGYLFGPGYTDVVVDRPLNYFLAIVSVVAALILVFSQRMEQVRWLIITAAAWAIAVGIGFVLPRLVQQTIVEPNELQKESPYIANNIALTRIGFGLDNVDMRTISGQGEPPASALQADSPVLRNVRLWDYRVARQTYQQLQSFVPYYIFHDVDVDRYPEQDAVQQVLASARELDISGLPPNAQTWTNEHLAYTHGYGVVVSPINEATSQGLPIFAVSGIPPESTGPETIGRPEIYFGETESPWVGLNTKTAEVNGIPGDTPPSPYSGLARGSIDLSNYFQRFVLAINLADRSILFTDQFTPQSRILLLRTITDRVNTIAPFLLLDDDPYLTIVDGRLTWIIDAYTSTDLFPYATPTVATAATNVNYIRHTVKAVVDAYDGTVMFYRTSTPDPVADAYMRLFPQLFRPISEASPRLAEHFRYPEELFDVQTRVLSAYHVTDPVAFYNGEDRWEIAQEEVETGNRGQTSVQPMESYYMTLPLPGETETGFKIIRPFTPINRPNMTAWMAGQSDASGSGRLVVYRFPRQTTIFGPQQVEARINQDPSISSQFTLLDQQGSRVIRGNLLVIPVDETVMYVQPVYIQATGTGGAPTELKFVIVATNEQVEMAPTLEAALAAVADADQSGTTSGGAGNVEAGVAPGSAAPTATAADALAAFQRGQRALQAGDWAAYGEAQAELQRILENLATSAGRSNQPVAAPPATPVP